MGLKSQDPQKARLEPLPSVHTWSATFLNFEESYAKNKLKK